jgi:hypothetical protein
MGNPLFGVDISGIIRDAIGPGVLDATLTRVTPGTRTAALTAGTQPTTVAYACKGFVDSQKVRFVNGTLVKAGQKVVVLIGDTIAGGTVAPQPGDRISIEGASYVIPEGGTIDRDPAGATYTCAVEPY